MKARYVPDSRCSVICSIDHAFVLCEYMKKEYSCNFEGTSNCLKYIRRVHNTERLLVRSCMENYIIAKLLHMHLNVVIKLLPKLFVNVMYFKL